MKKKLLNWCEKLHFPERTSDENERLQGERDKIRNSIMEVQLQEDRENMPAFPCENIEMTTLSNRKIETLTPKEQKTPLLEEQEHEPLIRVTGKGANESAQSENDINRQMLHTMKESNRYLRLLVLNIMTDLSDPSVEAGSDMKLIATTVNRVCGIILTIINMVSLGWMIFKMAIPNRTAE